MEEVQGLDDTVRGVGGFGSTGVNERKIMVRKMKVMSKMNKLVKRMMRRLKMRLRRAVIETVVVERGLRRPKRKQLKDRPDCPRKDRSSPSNS